jgi:YbbR domain-containing protein
MRSLRQNLGLKIVAVVVAAFFWVMAHQEAQKHGTRTFELPVRVMGADEKSVVVRQPQQVKVTLSGPRDFLDALDPNKLSAFVDAQGQTAGEFRRLVQYGPASLLTGLSVSIEPREVTFTLDQMVENELTVQVARTTQPPVGVEIESLAPSPPVAMVSGASVQVARVKVLCAEVDVAAQGDLTPGDHPIGDYPVHALDADGKQVANVSVTPPTVEVTLTVSRTAVTRTVLVSPRITGRPPGAYESQEITVEPSEITITGAPGAVAAVTTVRTEPIDISNLRDAVERIVSLVPIPHVSFGARHKVRVVVKVRERTLEGGAE